MTAAWHIDALDPLAGYCFGAFRVPDLDVDEVPDLDGPAVYLAPPAFQPEVVGSRATGFSATRGSFQLGLFLDGAEVGFPSLEALAEFVRRCYLSGGGTDGGGGRTPVPPPPQPEGGPDIPRPERRDGPGGAVRGLLEAGKELSKLSERLGRTAEPVPETSPLRLGGVAATKEDLTDLARAATLVMAQMLGGAPDRGDRKAWSRWAEAARRLGHAVGGLGLWPAVLSPPNRDPLVRLVEARATTWREIGPGEAEDWLGTFGIQLLVRLFGGALPAPPWGRHPWQVWAMGAAAPTDPLDDLASWPLPDLGAPAGQDPALPTALDLLTMRDLLSAAVASPDVLWTPDLAALLLFAAAHVVRHERPAGLYEPDDALQADLLLEHLDQALAWLARQFPRQVYRPPIEAMIRQVGRI